MVLAPAKGQLRSCRSIAEGSMVGIANLPGSPSCSATAAVLPFSSTLGSRCAIVNDSPGQCHPHGDLCPGRQ